MTQQIRPAVAINASQSAGAPTRVLVVQAVARLVERGSRATSIDLAALPAEGLLGRAPSARVAEAVAAVERAGIVVVGTPIYRASYSGLLKVFFDRLPQGALRDKVALPLATGGSAAHLLAIDHSVRPLLSSLGAVITSGSVFADESQISGGRIDREVVARVERAVDEALALSAALRPAPHAQAPPAFAGV